MSLYAIGDLHLHFQSELKAPGQLHEPVWKNHDVKFRQNCEKLIKPDDTLVLVGDHSWGKKLPECEKDLEYICSLPGRKILLRGNHDMFWDAKKTEALNKQYAGKLFFLQNNYASYQDYAIVGTKGFTFEGPFYVRGKEDRWLGCFGGISRNSPDRPGNGATKESPLRLPGRTDLAVLSCSCIILRQM